MNQRSGILILDTSCLKHLEDPSFRTRLQGSLRAVDLDLWLTGVNLLEVAQNQNASVRERLLRICRELAYPKGVLPLPFQILKGAATALLQDKPGWWTGTSGMESLMDDPANTEERIRAACAAYVAGIEGPFKKAHAKGRAGIQRVLKDKQIGDVWGNPVDFVDAQWLRPELLDSLVANLWRICGLSGKPPVERLLQYEPWKIILEAMGVVAYETCVAKHQPKPVGHADILQLIYLAVGRRRIFVTAERPLSRVANSVFRNRYGLTRVLTWDEFAALH